MNGMTKERKKEKLKRKQNKAAKSNSDMNVYVYLCEHLACHENLSMQVHWSTLSKKNDPFE